MTRDRALFCVRVRRLRRFVHALATRLDADAPRREHCVSTRTAPRGMRAVRASLLPALVRRNVRGRSTGGCDAERRQWRSRCQRDRAKSTFSTGRT
eukprot:2446046-Pleurochrysis_carterae.AAC.1